VCNRQVLDAYQRPYSEAFPVVCIDEKPVALFSDATPRLPARGPVEKRSSAPGAETELRITSLTILGCGLLERRREIGIRGGHGATICRAPCDPLEILPSVR
jgi:hypothetical protein